jgi:DNA-binding NtrC family response regulator
MSGMAGQKHILVVDDDGDVQGVIVDMLQERGYRVNSAANGISMRDFLQRDDPVNAIVLDAVMPGESGTALALHAKELGLSVVMISGSPEMMQFAIENGLQLLEKPFKMRELVNALAQALDSREFGQRPA